MPTLLKSFLTLCILFASLAQMYLGVLNELFFSNTKIVNTFLLLRIELFSDNSRSLQQQTAFFLLYYRLNSFITGFSLILNIELFVKQFFFKDFEYN